MSPIARYVIMGIDMRRLKKEELARRIDATGMKPYAFAVKHGIVPESLRRWLNGQREPKIDNIRELASALGCDVTDISEWVIVVDRARMAKQREQEEKLLHYWLYLTEDQQQQILNLVKSIAQGAIKKEGEI